MQTTAVVEWSRTPGYDFGNLPKRQTMVSSQIFIFILWLFVRENNRQEVLFDIPTFPGICQLLPVKNILHPRIANNHRKRNTLNSHLYFSASEFKCSE